jgi:hypothetical protein
MTAADRRIGAYMDVAFGLGPISLTAPTAVSVNTLTRVECALVGVGPDTPRSGTVADASGLCDIEDRQIAGLRNNGPITFPVFREFDATDTYWTLFSDVAQPPATQYLVISPGGFAGATAVATEKVDVYQVHVVSRAPVAVARGETQRFMVTLANIARAYGLALT